MTDTSSIVKLTISRHPRHPWQIMDNLFLGRVVESTIRADLEFRDYALKQNPRNRVRQGVRGRGRVRGYKTGTCLTTMSDPQTD